MPGPGPGQWLQFAHSDLSGYSVFEEAFSQGNWCEAEKDVGLSGLGLVKNPNLWDCFAAEAAVGVDWMICRRQPGAGIQRRLLSGCTGSQLQTSHKRLKWTP
jgi:hypothetical protein